MLCPIELKLKYFNMRYWLLKLIHFMTLVSFYTLWKPQKIRVVLKFWGLGTLQACNFIKKRLQYRSFPVNFAKLLRTSILKNVCQRLLLNADSSLSCHKWTKILQIFLNTLSQILLFGNSSFDTNDYIKIINSTINHFFQLRDSVFFLFFFIFIFFLLSNKKISRYQRFFY